LKGIGQLTWTALAEVLDEAARAAPREDECTYGKRAHDWLRDKLKPH
jgi:hypothetical protein